MIRVKIVRDIENFKAGEIVYIKEKVAKFLLKKGYAIKSKDMASNDYKTG